MSVFLNPTDKLLALAALWSEKPWTRPQPIGLIPSMGYGDRIGLATSGHILAHKNSGLERKVAPIFAQQSAREMARTGRSPVDVMLDACRALGESDYRGEVGADADHLKTREQVRGCMEAGFTWFTADPSDEVDDEADNLSSAQVEQSFQKLRTEFPREFDHYIFDYAQIHSIEGVAEPIVAKAEEIERIALKYGRALLRVRDIHDWITDGWRSDEPFDFEVSIDETSTHTTPLAHLLIIRELKRLGIRIVALAPRFVGEFQKGIDYIGDLEEFRQSLQVHVAIVRVEGPYKISVHSGSDKFSIYPILAEECGGLLHLKTAGTSYLEGLRVIARKNPHLFRSVAKFSAGVFENQRATYHLKADLMNFPDPDKVPDSALEKAFLVSPGAADARQILHVAFGSVLTDEGGQRFGEPMKGLLEKQNDEYADVLAVHFARHLGAFIPT